MCPHFTGFLFSLSSQIIFQQPLVVLHELAHAYHDQVLSWDYEPIREAFDAAVKEGQYEKVLHIDGRTVRHYALTDHKEYFAEATEAWFGCNDFYPFVRPELKKHDVESVCRDRVYLGRRKKMKGSDPRELLGGAFEGLSDLERQGHPASEGPSLALRWGAECPRLSQLSHKGRRWRAIPPG